MLKSSESKPSLLPVLSYGLMEGTQALSRRVMVVQLKQKGEREGAEAPRKAIHIRLRQKGKASQDGDSRRAFVAVVIVKLSRNHLQGRVWEAETPRKDWKAPQVQTPTHTKGIASWEQAGRAVQRGGCYQKERSLAFSQPASPAAAIPISGTSHSTQPHVFSHLHRLFP